MKYFDENTNTIIDKPKVYKNIIFSTDEDIETTLNELNIFRIEEPILNEFQKKGDFIKNKNIYTWKVIDFTQEEIDTYQKSLVPKTATKLKFKLTLIDSGISLTSINQAIEQMPDSPTKERIQTLLNDATYFDREDTTLIGMATQLGITEEQLDNLFILSNNETI